MSTVEPPPGLRVIEVTRDWAMGEYERCVAMLWLSQPDDNAMRRRADALLQIAQKYPGRCALVEIVEPGCVPPTQDTRRVAMEVFKKLGGDLNAIAFVIEGGEMRQALIRAVITSMLFFVKQPQPSRVFKKLTAMIEWVRPRLTDASPGFDTGLTAAFEHLRALAHAARDQAG